MRGLSDKFDLFIFDWDGTLSSVKLLRKINEKVNPFWKYKKDVQSRAVMEKEQDFDKLASKVKRGMHRKSTETRLFAPIIDFSISLTRPKLHNDSRELLEDLRRRKKKVVLLTNGASWRVAKELELLDVSRYFDLVVSAQDLKILKPNPLGINVILALMKTKRSRAVYIGDMGDDILLAKYAKVSSCALACGFDNYQKLKSFKPDYLFRSVEMLWKAL